MDAWAKCPDTGVRMLLEALREGVAAALGANLVGLYVDGSLTLGEFEPATSDIDVMGVTRTMPPPDAIAALADLRRSLAAGFAYGSRLEGTYAPLAALRPWGVEGEIVAVSPSQGFAAGAHNC